MPSVTFNFGRVQIIRTFQGSNLPIFESPQARGKEVKKYDRKKIIWKAV